MEENEIKPKNKKALKIIIFASFAVFILIAAFAGGILFTTITSPAFNSKKISYIFIDEEKDYDAVLNHLNSVAGIKNIKLFEQLAAYMKYPQNIKTGKYEINPKLSYLELARMLRNGNQVPIKFTFNNIRFKKDFAEKAGNQFLFGQEVLFEKLNSQEVCQSLGFDTTTIMTMFLPNTYEIYWTVSVTQFLERMKKEHDRFWNEQRLKKAREIPLSPVEVSILASIVEEETADQSEFSVVAGLYINRLRKGMLLQADPTLKFAAGNFELKRILYVHFEIDSPYNTYKNQGLPPGPIRIPSISGIEAVLNYSHHNYLFMVAKEDFSGKHNFAVTLSEHNRNAKRYHGALDRNGVR